MSLLQRTVVSLIRESNHKHARHLEQYLSQYETWELHHLLKQLLCIRPPQPPLSPRLLEDIDSILRHSCNQRVLIRGSSIPVHSILRRPAKNNVQLKLWQGDITSLASDVTAITNAANSQMLGCFQPTHKCIDNVIHSFAGPRLRQECFDAMEARGSDLPVGEAVVTKGYCLPSPYIIHTVGPQLEKGATPSHEEIQQLRQCYISVLEQAESLPANEDGSKRVALCCISTGLFAFPAKTAAKIAVDTVAAWIAHNEDTTLTDIILVTFAEGDYEIYNTLLPDLKIPWQSQNPHSPQTEDIRVESTTLLTAKTWLNSADTILISAGAGLSAADGLDYTSTALFKSHFPTYTALGLSTLYSGIGFAFPSEATKWSYYLTNTLMLRSWRSWPLYQRLIPWLHASGKAVHIRTSNADGAFLANGWDEARLSTPQGRYSVLQCLAKCRPDATFDADPFFDAALPFFDRETQRLTDTAGVPRCAYCGGEMMLCVRGGEWFNDTPFQDGEARWRDFRREVLTQGGETVVLELGVGMNTPGVLRWPNEDLVRKGGGKVRLVRVGLGPAAVVPEDLEEEGLAVSVDGDIKVALPALLDM